MEEPILQTGLRLIIAEQKREQYLMACTRGETRLIMSMFEMEEEKEVIRDNYFLTKCLNTACEAGHSAIVKMIISHEGGTWFNLKFWSSITMEYACGGGNSDVIDMISTFCKCETNRKTWYYALLGACRKSKVKTLKQYMNKTDLDQEFWDRCLIIACELGDMEMSLFAIEQGADDWCEGLSGACENNQFEMIRFMIKCGKFGAANLKYNLYDACHDSNLRLVELFIEYENVVCDSDSEDDEDSYKDDEGYDWNKCLMGACNGGSVEMVEYFFNRGGVIDYNQGLTIANSHGHDKIVEFMIESGANNIYELENTNHFKIRRLWCKAHDMDPLHDFVCMDLLLSYPPYVLLVNKINSSIKRLPHELTVLMTKY